MQSTFDSDFDGKPDRIHFDITRPKETGDGPEGPDDHGGQPVLREPRAEQQLVGRRRDRRHAAGAAVPAELHDPQHEPEDLERPSRTRGCRAGSRSCTPRTRAPGHSDGCPTDGAPNENDAMKAVVDWLNGRAPGVHDPDRYDHDLRRLGDRQGRDDGHVLQRLAADRGRRDGRRRPRGDRPDLPGLRLLRVLPRQRHGARARAAGRARTPTCWSTSSTRARTRPTRGMICRAADRADRRRRRTASRATATPSGTRAT